MGQARIQTNFNLLLSFKYHHVLPQAGLVKSAAEPANPASLPTPTSVPTIVLSPPAPRARPPAQGRGSSSAKPKGFSVNPAAPGGAGRGAAGGPRASKNAADTSQLPAVPLPPVTGACRFAACYVMDTPDPYVCQFSDSSLL